MLILEEPALFVMFVSSDQAVTRFADVLSLLLALNFRRSLSLVVKIRSDASRIPKVGLGGPMIPESGANVSKCEFDDICPLPLD